MSEQSKYGGWESRGEKADMKLWAVASKHHAFPSIRGIECSCGHWCGTNRAFTEHIIDMTVKALAAAVPEEGTNQ